MSKLSRQQLGNVNIGGQVRVLDPDDDKTYVFDKIADKIWKCKHEDPTINITTDSLHQAYPQIEWYSTPEDIAAERKDVGIPPLGTPDKISVQTMVLAPVRTRIVVKGKVYNGTTTRGRIMVKVAAGTQDGNHWMMEPEHDSKTRWSAREIYARFERVGVLDVARYGGGSTMPMIVRATFPWEVAEGSTRPADFFEMETKPSVGVQQYAHLSSPFGSAFTDDAKIGLTLDLDDPFEAAVAAMVEVNRRKRRDYAVDGSPFSNFEGSSDLLGFDGFGPTEASLFNVTQKLMRLKSLRHNGRLDDTANESVEDTYLDLAVYAVITYAIYLSLHRPVQEQTQQEG